MASACVGPEAQGCASPPAYRIAATNCCAAANLALEYGLKSANFTVANCAALSQGSAKRPRGSRVPTLTKSSEGDSDEQRNRRQLLPPTDIRDPNYFHKVVDCQWACPAHTPVPEYIRLIAAGRYTDAYLVNWRSNVFPGILGRTCDRPCEPACRRGRVEAEPVAICRLKRVAADNKSDIGAALPRAPERRLGKRVALIGAGPASLTVARDLAPLGYEIVIFDAEKKGGGMIRSQIPRFRLPEEVIDEEVGYVLDLGVDFRAGERIDSL